MLGTENTSSRANRLSEGQHALHPAGWAGMGWLALAVGGNILLFWPALVTLAQAWQVPEYSHGPLIPVLSALLFLRQIRSEPVIRGPVNRRPGLALLALSLLLALLGLMIETPLISAVGMILWWGAILLVSFGWDQGKRFWPPILHLFFMMPIPSGPYYQLSTFLQLISAEMGVWLLRLAQVPVFLDGHIIDLGVLKLHVAEACSGLRYLFPILSFSYVFAFLFQGSWVMKTILLLAAAPIAMAMNAFRIAVAGLIVQYQGVDHLEGFSHFFEGWIIFLLSVILLFLLARVLLLFQSRRLSLIDALDLDFSGLGPQARRILLIEPSRALAVLAIATTAMAAAWHSFPATRTFEAPRAEFASFPTQIGDWEGLARQSLDPQVAATLNAQDYLLSNFRRSDGAVVEVFAAWFRDQTLSGAHSPEICLPGGGWEFASLTRQDIGPALGLDRPFPVNRAVIQKGEERMMVYYFYTQNGRQIAGDLESKLWLLRDSLIDGRKDGGLVRLVTALGTNETEATAERRLQDMALELEGRLERFFPGPASGPVSGAASG